jgi:tight adherence protein B
VLVAVVTMHRQTGGNLALLVDRLAAMIRSRNHFRGQVAAVTALGRLSGLFIAVAAPAFMAFYWFVHPEYLTRLTENQQGLTMLITAIVLEVVGVTWLLWLLRVDY